MENHSSMPISVSDDEVTMAEASPTEPSVIAGGSTSSSATNCQTLSIAENSSARNRGMDFAQSGIKRYAERVPASSISGMDSHLCSPRSMAEFESPSLKGMEEQRVPSRTVMPSIPKKSTFNFSISAFKPCVIQTSVPPTSSQIHGTLNSTPSSSQNETANVSLTQVSTSLPVSTRPVFLGQASDDDRDGRTTLSAPPCTPAPELLHQQPHSPFRNARQITKIDLLAMSRSRQSDRAENARRDGRLAPSPRKKDEIFWRSQTHTTTAWEGSGSRLTEQDSVPGPGHGVDLHDTDVANERVGNGTPKVASPNVDVVSIDDQPDTSKCTLSIQFSDFESTQQMMKCSLCGFVTNNQRFYRRHRRLHISHYHPRLICSQCDYSTSHMSKMREHNRVSHISHSHTFAITTQSLNPGLTLSASNPSPSFHQRQMYLSTDRLFSPAASKPVDVSTATVSSASTVGLTTYIPGPHLNRVQLNNQIELQHTFCENGVRGNGQPSNEKLMASYMRSLISDLMSPSCSDQNSYAKPSTFYLQGARNIFERSASPLSSNCPTVDDNLNYRNFWNHAASSSNTNDQTLSDNSVKVKTEPSDSSAVLVSHTALDRSQGTCPDLIKSPCFQSNIVDRSLGMDQHYEYRHPTLSPSRDSFRINKHNDKNQNAAINQANSRSADFGSQFPVPEIKFEFQVSNVESNSNHHHGHSVATRTDQSIQCNIFSQPDPCSYSRSPNQSATASTVTNVQTEIDGGVHADILSSSVSLDQTEAAATNIIVGQGSSAGGVASGPAEGLAPDQTTAASTAADVSDRARCHHCGITFDDEVLFSIHIGCHSHVDPFVCNVCGQQCNNKYSFYSHITRNHHT